jgi:hypothetical protein
MRTIAAIITILLSLSVYAEPRVFTGKNDRRVKGEITNYNPENKTVSIRLINDQVIDTSIRDLSGTDQKYIEKWYTQKLLRQNSEYLYISGFEISFLDDCSVTITLDGYIKEITFPPGDIKRDSSDLLKNVGNAEVKRHSSGKLKNFGRSYIQRDSKGRATNIGGVEIKRDSEDRIKSIGGAEIKRDSSGNIRSIYDNNAPVRPIFSVKTGK